jgi:ubiquinone/menaquinone biosynthesis C-methylase UbiE
MSPYTRGSGRTLSTAGISVSTDDVGSINRSTWAKQRTLRYFEQVSGFSDAGEEQAIADVAANVRGVPILDIGVGAGRTIPLMLELSNNYTAVDFLPEMVDAAKRKFPDLRIEWADARDLSRFTDEEFGFVMFSWNGIDAIDHEGRKKALHEIHRVLAPGGRFLFSTLNEHGPEARAKPWTASLNQAGGSGIQSRLRRVGTMPLDLFNYLRYRKDWRAGSGWSVRSLSSHHFGLVTHYTTLERELTELSEIGFSVVSIRENSTGAVVREGDDTTNSSYFHIVVSKPT